MQWLQPSKRKLYKGNNKDKIILILKTKRVKISKIAPIFSVQQCKIHANIKNKQGYDCSKKSLIKATSYGN
ncbi:hypothetical protein HpBT0258_14630 [Helicobacter pylori]